MAPAGGAFCRYLCPDPHPTLVYVLDRGLLPLLHPGRPWGAVRRKKFRPVLANLLRFGLPSAVIILVVLLPTFRTILTTDYADIYGAYYGGGFAANCLGQLKTQGILWLLAALLGLLSLLGHRQARGPAAVTAAASLLAMVLFTRTQSLGDHQSLILAPLYLLGLFGAAAGICAIRSAWAMRSCTAALAFFLAVNAGNTLRLPGASVSTVLLSGESLDLTRRTDLDAMKAVTDFVLNNCAEEETVYINIDTDGYSGSTFAYSDPAHPQLQSMILWENSVPSTHGFPTGIWSSKYVMVTDKLEEGGLVGAVNLALRSSTPSSSHYRYVTEFPLQNGIVLYCYERLTLPMQPKPITTSRSLRNMTPAGPNCSASASMRIWQILAVPMLRLDTVS